MFPQPQFDEQFMNYPSQIFSSPQEEKGRDFRDFKHDCESRMAALDRLDRFRMEENMRIYRSFSRVVILLLASVEAALIYLFYGHT